MTKAVKAGIPKLKIEESATKKQAKVDSGDRVVVGVNKFKNPKEPKIDVRVIDNDKVREDQINKIIEVMGMPSDEILEMASPTKPFPMTPTLNFFIKILIYFFKRVLISVLEKRCSLEL